MKKILFPVTLTIYMIVFCLSSCNETISTNSVPKIEELGYYIKTAELPTLFRKEKASIFFVEKWATPEFHNIVECEPVWTGISHDQKMFLGCEEDKLVYFISEVVTDFDDTIALEKFFLRESVVKDPRTTSAWINSILCLIEDDSMGDNEVDLKDFIGRATYSEGERDGKFASYRHDLERKIMAEEGKTVKEKLVNFTSRLVPGSPRNWEKRQWFYAEWNYLESEPSY